MKKTYCTTVMLGLVLFLSSFISGCLGPADTPDFTKFDWVSMEVQYGFVATENDIVKRKVVLSGKELSSLKKLFLPKDIRGMSVGNSDSSILTLNNGEMWKFEFTKPRSVTFCLTSNEYYHYVVDLSDELFYQKVKEICLNNELSFTPQAKIENICVCIGGEVVITEEKCEPFNMNNVAIQGVVVHDVSSEPIPQVSDAISGENPESEQVDDQESD